MVEEGSFQFVDPVLEELTGNKLELVSPLVDGFLKEIGLSINAKLARSRMTGLMAPINLFMPFQIFKHIWVLVNARSLVPKLHFQLSGKKLKRSPGKSRT